MLIISDKIVRIIIECFLHLTFIFISLKLFATLMQAILKYLNAVKGIRSESFIFKRSDYNHKIKRKQ